MAKFVAMSVVLLLSVTAGCATQTGQTALLSHGYSAHYEPTVAGALMFAEQPLELRRDERERVAVIGFDQQIEFSRVRLEDEQDDYRNGNRVDRRAVSERVIVRR